MKRDTKNSRLGSLIPATYALLVHADSPCLCPATASSLLPPTTIARRKKCRLVNTPGKNSDPQRRLCQYKGQRACGEHRVDARDANLWGGMFSVAPEK